MEWQQIVMDAIVVVFMALASWVWKSYAKPFMENYVKPYLITHDLVQAAKLAVQAAEAIYGRFHGEDKLKEAMKQLSNKGWNIDSEIVINAVHAAWAELNLAQISAGVKEPNTEG